ncbi:MAG: integrase [Gammaproteobacteria bacterium]|nr:MAG: integrase [Gammaproteobacteria bacterium]
MKPTDFAKVLSEYLAIYLPGQCNASPNTIKSYRDTFKLLLLYCKQNCHLSIERLCLKKLDKPLIIGFLNWLEKERNNSIATRNQRLACIHGFFQFVQLEEPAGLLSYHQILSIPIKKTQTKMINHLTPDALKLILDQPDSSITKGRRDLTLLCVLYDSGARVQELVDLKLKDIRLNHPPVITLTGKGRKTRQVPIMSNTEALLKQYIGETFSTQNEQQDYPLFFNRQRRKMTRAGISYILDKYVSQARTTSSIIPCKVTPHVIRHTKAMLLLQAGVNLIYIRDFLGHVDIETTEIYARADTEMKRKALENAYPEIVGNNLPNWQKDEALLTWLASL